jgi:PAS domain S-box-containing protein
MTWFVNLPFRWKLLGAIGLVLVLAAALVVVAYRTSVATRRAAAQVGHTLRVLDLASDAQAGVLAMDSAYRDFVVTGSDDGLVPYGTGSALYQARLGDLQAEVADDPAEDDAWRAVDQRVVSWRSQVTEPTIQLRRDVAAGRASLDDLAALDRTGEPTRQFEAVRAAFAQAITARERLLAEQTQAADEANAALQRLLIAGIVAAAAVGVGVAWLLAWHLTRPVALLARTARAIADGDLSRRVKLARRDEVGLAAEAFDRMADSLERAIRQRESILRAAAEGILGVDPSGTITFANPAAARLTGRAVEDLVGRPLCDAVHRRLAEGGQHVAADCPLRASLGRGVREGVEDLFWRPDGTSYPVEYTGAPVTDDGRIAGSVMTFRDVGERRRADAERLARQREEAGRAEAEAARAEAERAAQHFGDLVHGLGVVVWEREPHTCQFTFVSRGAEDMLGYPVERWLDPDFWARLIDPDDRERVMRECQAAAEHGQKWDYEYRALAADDRVLWVREILHVVRDTSGKARQLRGVLTNITERKQLLESERRARQAAESAAARAASLQAITAALSQALTPGEVAEAIITRGLSGVGAVAGSVSLLSHDGTALQLLRVVGLPTEVVEVYRRVPVTAAMPMTQAVRSGEPVWLESVEEAAPRFPEYAEHPTGFGAGAALPLLVGDRAIGVLGLSFAQARGLDAEDRAFLVALSGQCAQALERARLYEVERRAHARSEVERRRAQFLAEAGTALISSLHYEATLQSVARLAVPFLADWCAVDVVDEHGAVRRVAVAHVDPSREALVWRVERRDLTEATPEAGLGRILRTGQAELMSDVPAELLVRAAKDAESLELARALAPRSYIGVPLVARGQTLGAVLLVAAESGRRYGPDDLALAEELGRRASQAVDNARLYAQAQQAVRVRDEFLAATSHELRTPLAHVKGFVSTLRQSDVQWDEATRQDFLREIEREADRLTRLISNLLDISRIESGGLERAERAPTSPRALVTGGLDRVRLLLGQRQVAVDVPDDLPQVYVDSTQLEGVFANLLENAAKYTPAKSPLRLAGRLVEGGVELRVEDEGPGIPPEDLERIFEKFVRSSTVRSSVPGTGLGLAICRGIVRANGGRIWAENRPTGGASFVVWLPVARADP